MIDCLARAMTHRMGEIDKRVLQTDDQLEIEWLYRSREKLEKLFKKLIGRTPPNPGK